MLIRCLQRQEGRSLRGQGLRRTHPLSARLDPFDRSPQGGSLGRNDDANGSPIASPFTAPADGEYVIAIQDHLLKGGPDYAYRIEVGPIEPRLTLSLPNESVYQRRNPTVAVAVPKGGRQAILVNAARTGFSGDVLGRRRGANPRE